VHLSPRLLFILPAPLEIFQTLIEMHERFLFHTTVTLREMFAGFLIAFLIAFPLAWTMVRYESSRTLLQPVFIVIQCVPMFTLAPIMVAWFGWGFTAIVIPTALMIFFPLTLNIYQGLKSTPKELLELFQTYQATPLQTFFKLRLPYAMPHIFAGFRISAAIAGTGAVAGEWAGAQTGLGILMLESRRNTDLAITFAALLCLILISTLLYGFILYCEKISLPPRQWAFPFSKFFSKTAKSQKKRLVLPFFLFLLLASFLFGCQQPPKENQTRLLLDWIPNPNHVPLYVGLKQGFFAEEGIDLSIQKMHEEGGAISYLIAKKADLLINHMPGTLKACSHGAKLKIIGSLIKQPLCGLTYHSNPSIRKASDLTDKVLGYCIGVPDIQFLDFLLKQGNIYPREKKNVSVDLISAMGNHQVDFIYGAFWNIEPAQLSSFGVETETFKLQELGIPSYYEMIIVANRDTEHAAPQFVEKFQRALQKSIDYCKQYPEAAFSCYIFYNQDRRQKTHAWQQKAWELTLPLLTDDQLIDEELVETFYKWQVEHDIIEDRFDWKSLIL